MAILNPQQAAAARVASGASTINTAQPGIVYQQANNPTVQKTTTPAPVQTVKPTPSVQPSNQGDISDVFKGTAQFQPAKTQQTYTSSTGQLTSTPVGQPAPMQPTQATPAMSQPQNPAMPQVQPKGQVASQSALDVQKQLNQPNQSLTPAQAAAARFASGASTKNTAISPQNIPPVQQTTTPSIPQPPAQSTQTGPAQPQATQTSNAGQMGVTTQTSTPFSTSVTTQMPNGQATVQYTNSNGSTSLISPDEAHKNDIKSALSDNGSKSMADQLSSIINAPPGTSAAEILKLSLGAQLGLINDPTVNNLLDNSALRAKASYDAGLALTQNGLDEINKAIDGTLTAPTTAAGLQAKIYQEGKTEQQASVNEELNYQEKTHDNQMTQLRDNRDRLEGYSKAKLEAMGALDSSAGITLLSKMSQGADLQIEQANLDYDHSHQQLVLQGNKITNDYTNSVASLVQQTNAQKATYLKDFKDQTNAIDDKRLASNQSKQQMTLQAFSQYSDKSVTLAAQQKQQQLDYLKFAYDQHKDLIDQSYKMSGMMGTIYAPDKNGQLVDTGMPTLDSVKNAQDFQYKNSTLAQKQQEINISQGHLNLDTAHFGLDQQKFSQQTLVDRSTMVKGYFEQWANTGFDEKKGAFLEQAMGLANGSVTRFGSDLNAAKNYVNGQVYQAQQGLDKANASSPQITVSPAVNDIFGVGKAGGWCGAYSNSLVVGSHAGDTWASKAALITHQDNPQPGQQMLLPIGVKTDTDYGHVATVLSYDPTSKDITTIESNHDGRQNHGKGPGQVTINHYNLTQLQNQYKTFGFSDSQFRPDIQQKLSALSPQDSQVNVYKPPQQDTTQGGPQKGGFMGTDFSISDISGSNGNALLKTQNDRSAYTKEWTSGTAPKSTAVANTSFNNALGHLALAQRVFSAMNNNNIKTSNEARDWLSRNAGTNPDVSAFLAIRGQVGNEVTAAVKGGVPTSEEVQELNSIFSADQSPQQMLASLKAQAQLIGTRVSTNEEQYKTFMGNYPPPILTSEAQNAATSLGLNLSDISPVLKDKAQDPGNIKANIASSKTAGADNGQIFQSLLTNPATASEAAHLAAQGYTPDDIVQAFSN